MSVISPPAALITAWMLAHTWRNWATTSPLPTTTWLPARATWPAMNTSRPCLTSKPYEKPCGFGSVRGSTDEMWSFMSCSPPLGRAVEHDGLAVERDVAQQLQRGVGDFLGLDEPAARVHLRERGHRVVERAARLGHDVARAVPHHVGRDEARTDRIDGDALAADLGGERAREADQRVLGGRGGRNVRRADEPGQRGHVDDAPPAALQHAAEHRTRGQGRPRDGDAQVPLPHLVRRPGQGR